MEELLILLNEIDKWTRRSGGIFLSLLLFLSTQCKNKSLPILGHRQEINGQVVYSKVPSFQLFNQDSVVVDSAYINDRCHLACFFFSSCPSICPKVMRSIKFLEGQLGDREDLLFLCFSIDHKRDTVRRLKEYKQRIGIQSNRVHFLHIPDQAEVKRISEAYMSTALEDPQAPGGFDHSGWILLVDKNRHLRAYASGTDDKEVKRLAAEVKALLNEDQR